MDFTFGYCGETLSLNVCEDEGMTPEAFEEYASRASLVFLSNVRAYERLSAPASEEPLT